MTFNTRTKCENIVWFQCHWNQRLCCIFSLECSSFSVGYFQNKNNFHTVIILVKYTSMELMLIFIRTQSIPFNTHCENRKFDAISVWFVIKLIHSIQNTHFSKSHRQSEWLTASTRETTNKNKPSTSFVESDWIEMDWMRERIDHSPAINVSNHVSLALS